MLIFRPTSAARAKLRPKARLYSSFLRPLEWM